MVANLKVGPKRRALTSGAVDGLSVGRSSSLLGGLVARVAPAPKLEAVPKRSLRAAPKHVQEAVKVVEDYVQSLSEPDGPGGGS